MGRGEVNDLLRRRRALEATLAKYRGKPLDYRTADCVRMVRFHLEQLGYSPPPLPRYSNAIGAQRALRKAGGLAGVLDAMLERIAPAAMLPGDIAVIEGEAGMDSATICVGHKLIGWHEDSDELVNLTWKSIKRSWRV